MMTRLTILLPLVIAAAALMNGCASPEPRYYTLAADSTRAATAVTRPRQRERATMDRGHASACTGAPESRSVGGA
jgi:uncharacterized lipoprotein YmbA